MSRRTRTTDPELARAEAMAARLDAARANPEAAMREIMEDDAPQTRTTAVLDPPESGPPTAAELGQEDEDPRPAQEAIASQIAGPGQAMAGHVAEHRRKLAAAVNEGVDPTTKAAQDAMAGMLAPVWPTGPLTIDWPWGVEPDPQVGEVVGWNWGKGKVAVVTRQPEIQGTEPWRITVEPRAMTEEWRGPHKVLDLDHGGIVEVVWYTRWNRAYAAPGGVVGCESPGSGWLAVVKA